jgi:hypothetical protein
MINRIFYLLVIVLVTVTACDDYDISDIQSESFIKFYNPYPVFNGVDAKQTNNGYALLGTVETFSLGRQVCLLKTDAFGNVTDSAKYYGRSLDDNAYNLQVLADGFAILGSSQNPNTGKLEVYFIRTDEQGDTLWTRSIGYEGGDTEAYHFETDSKGSFIMTGYTKNPSTLDKQIWLFALENDGNDAWLFQRVMGGDKDEEGTHLQILPDERIIVTGWSLSYTRNTGKKTQFILITNSIGGVVSFIPVRGVSAEPATVYDEDAACIRLLDDGSFLIVGTTNTADKGTDIIVKKVSLVSSNITPVWEKQFGSTGNDVGVSAINEGNRYTFLTTTSGAGDNSAITLINVDTGGLNPGYFTYGQGSKLSGHSFEKTDDHGFIISGSNVHLETHSSGFLLKLKPDRTL